MGLRRTLSTLLIANLILLFASPSPAQAVTAVRPLPCDVHTGAGGVFPTGDADGDGFADDVRLEEIKFDNTWVQIWCIKNFFGIVGSAYYATLVDGVAGQAFRFVGKCAFWRAENDWALNVAPGTNILASIVHTTTSITPFIGGESIRYVYNAATGTSTAVFFDSDGNRTGATEFTPPTAPFNSGSIPDSVTSRVAGPGQSMCLGPLGTSRGLG